MFAFQLSTDKGHAVKLQDVRSILSSIHALDQSANFCLRQISVDILLEDGCI